MTAAGILMVAAGLRALVLVLTRHHWSLITDNAYYSSVASSIAHGHGFGATLFPGLHGPSAFRTPLYPLLLAPVYWLFGVHPFLGRAENVLFGTAAVAAIGLLAVELLGRRRGLVVMGLAAVYPPLLLDSYGLQYEALLIVFTCLAMTSALRSRRLPTQWRWTVATGLFVGLGVLTRETGALVLVPFWLMTLLSRRLGWRRRLVQCAVGLAVAVGVVAPWTVRNAVVLHAFVPVSTDLAFAVEGTYNPTAAHFPGSPTLWVVPYQDPGTEAAMLRSNRTEVAVEQLLERRALHYVAGHPTYPLQVLAWNAIRMFDLRGFRDELFIARYVPFNPTLVRAAVIGFYVVAALALVGLFSSVRREVPWPVWTFPLLATAAICLVLGNLRYRSVIEPYFLLLAGCTLTLGWDRARMGNHA